MISRLAPLGLSETEEAIYRWLVSSGLSSLSEIARGAGVGLAQVRLAIEGLEHAGAVVRAPGRPARYNAAAPDLALEGLIIERIQALDHARLEVRRLQEDFRRGAERRNPAELAEIVQGKDTVRDRADRLSKSAREEILVFDKPPYAIPPDENATEDHQLRSGIKFRSIYSRESLDWPGALEPIQRFVQAGEDARFHPAVPIKLNIFDRRVALLPLAEEEGVVEGAIVVHSSHLLDALVVLWQTFWERAFPLPLGGFDPGSLGDSVTLSDDDARLAALLLAGSTSRAIARRLNMGSSTVERRIKRLMSVLGVETRVQIGYELCRRGIARSDNATG